MTLIDDEGRKKLFEVGWTMMRAVSCSLFLSLSLSLYLFFSLLARNEVMHLKQKKRKNKRSSICSSAAVQRDTMKAVPMLTRDRSALRLRWLVDSGAQVSLSRLASSDVLVGCVLITGQRSWWVMVSWYILWLLTKKISQ